MNLLVSVNFNVLVLEVCCHTTYFIYHANNCAIILLRKILDLVIAKHWGKSNLAWATDRYVSREALFSLLWIIIKIHILHTVCKYQITGLLYIFLMVVLDRLSTVSSWLMTDPPDFHCPWLLNIGNFLI